MTLAKVRLFTVLTDDPDRGETVYSTGRGPSANVRLFTLLAGGLSENVRLFTVLADDPNKVEAACSIDR